MISIDQFRNIALSFSETNEEPHFEKTSFRIKKKIFATYDAKKHMACLKLSASEQDIFSLIDNTIIYPVPNKWGNQGWTMVRLSDVDEVVFADMLKAAYGVVTRKRM